MADPISGSGTAIGVVALGITVCQGLIKYYAPLKARDSDIQAALDHLEGIQETLGILQAKLPETSTASQTTIDNVEKKILSCQKGIENLNEYLEKCRATKPAVDWTDKMRAQKQKLLYPFRQNTLQDLERGCMICRRI